MANIPNFVNLQLIEEIEGAEFGITPRRRFERLGAFDLPDHQFIKLFRLNKASTREVIELVEPYLTPAVRSTALESTTKVLTSLKFFASGSYQTDVGINPYTAVSQPSVSRCVNEVSAALNHPNIFNQFVNFPRTNEELKSLRNRFFEKYGFPGVVGAIDCTHVAVIGPKNNEHVYVNRKNYHSINVQLVCNADLKILNCRARFPGSTNDSYIWNNSNLKQFFIELHANGSADYLLLGDSGYALLTYMQTPITNPEPQLNTPEYRYNEAQIRARATIERCNGVLKARFQCLLKHRVLHYEPGPACKIINACVVLHNICIANNVPEVEGEGIDGAIDFGIVDEIPANNNMRRSNPDLAQGRLVQRKIIRNCFT